MKDAIWTELPIIAEDAMVDEPDDALFADTEVPVLVVFIPLVSSEATRCI